MRATRVGVSHRCISPEARAPSRTACLMRRHTCTHTPWGFSWFPESTVSLAAGRDCPGPPFIPFFPPLCFVLCKSPRPIPLVPMVSPVQTSNSPPSHVSIICPTPLVTPPPAPAHPIHSLGGHHPELTRMLSLLGQPWGEPGQGMIWAPHLQLCCCAPSCAWWRAFLSRNLPLSSATLRTRVRPPPSTRTRRVVGCSWCPPTARTAGKWLRIYKPFSVLCIVVNTTTWAHRLSQISSRCKLLQGIIMLKRLSLPPPPQEHFAKKDFMNSSKLWYSTVSQDVKREAPVINSDNQTEYAAIKVPKKKENIASAEEHHEYDYVLIT